MKNIILFLVACFYAYTCSAHALNFKISERDVVKNFTFHGQNITVSGQTQNGDTVAVVVLGPKKSYQIQRKEWEYGIWINGKKLNFNDIYSFYHLASSKPLLTISSEANLKSLKLTPDSLTCTAKEIVADSLEKTFCQAFHDEKVKAGLYGLNASKIAIQDNTFSTTFHIPEVAVSGRYDINIFTFNPFGKLTHTEYLHFYVRDGGFYKKLNEFANNYPITHSLLAITFALGMGSIVSFSFNRRRSLNGKIS